MCLLTLTNTNNVRHAVHLLHGGIGKVHGGLLIIPKVKKEMHPVLSERCQMTRFRDAKVCNNWLQTRIDDPRIQSDYKCKSGLQNPEEKTLHLALRLRGDDARQHVRHQ